MSDGQSTMALVVAVEDVADLESLAAPAASLDTASMRLWLSDALCADLVLLRFPHLPSSLPQPMLSSVHHNGVQARTGWGCCAT